MRLLVRSASFLAALLFASAALAHHSFSAEFDVGKPVEFSGTVNRFEFVNPHAWVHIDVTNAEGEVETWAVELLGKNSIARNGLTPDVLKDGDRVTVKGFAARDGTNTANASSLTRTDTGETLYASDPADRNR